MHRAPLNELRRVHHEAVFGAPGLSVPEKGVSGTEYPSCTVEACFLHRMPQKMRRVPQEPIFCTARIFRTVGGPLRYRILRMPEKRRALPALNASSDRKEKGIACTEFIKLPEKRRALSGTCPGMPPRARKSQPPSPKHTGKQHHNSKTHHSYTPSYTLGQQKAPPASTVTSPGCPKSPLLKVQSAFWAILAGVELTEGVLFGQAPPRAQKRSPD